jgi:hypothetical protein
VKKRTLWLVVGFAALSGWTIAHLREGVHLVLFACAMGLVVWLGDADFLSLGDFHVSAPPDGHIS